MYDEQRNTVWRFAIIFIAIFIGFAAVLGRIIYIQGSMVEGRRATSADTSSYRCYPGKYIGL